MKINNKIRKKIKDKNLSLSVENNFMSDEMWNEFLIKIEQNKNKNKNIK